MKILYTETDEAPALATRSLLPIVRAFAAAAAVEIELRDISLAGRILAQFPDRLGDSQRVPDALAELGELARTPQANIIKLPNISASVPQLKAAIAELRAKGYDVPEYPEEPSDDEQRDVRARYDRVKGSAVNPVLRQGNSDRRASSSVKQFARSHPHPMGAWSRDSRSHVSTMSDGDFRATERSVTMPREGLVRIEHVGSDGTVTVLKERTPVLAGEVLDAAVMRHAALQAFLSEQVGDAKRRGVLFSVHLKATMMKVSDPIIFGHAVRAYFENVFNEHADALGAAGVNANDGLAALQHAIEALPEHQRAAVRAAIDDAYRDGPGLAMVNSDRGITNLHVPSDVIIDASMPAAIRLSTGVRLLPVAISVAVTSVVGTRLAVRVGTKLVVATGLLSLAAGLGWTSSVAAGTSYLVIVGQMVLLGCGIGLTSAPATEAIMGVVPPEKAGIGSAINDATRVFGATLGVAVIGSVYASLYASRLTTLLAGRLPDTLARVAHDSVGAALTVAERLTPAHPQLAAGVHAAASGAFFHGFQAGCLLAAGVGVIGALLAGVLLPAQPQLSHAASTAPAERPTPSLVPVALPGSRANVTGTSSAAAPATAAAPAIARPARSEPAVISMLVCVAGCQSAGAAALHHRSGHHIAATRRFYRDAFGWHAEPMATSYDPAVDTNDQVIRGGTGAAGLVRRLLGHDPAVLDAHADNVAFYVQVPDLAAAVQRIETLGGTLVQGPISGTHRVQLALIADPQGALVGLFSR